mgnify:CR=1 FL=1
MRIVTGYARIGGLDCSKELTNLSVQFRTEFVIGTASRLDCGGFVMDHVFKAVDRQYGFWHVVDDLDLEAAAQVNGIAVTVPGFDDIAEADCFNYGRTGAQLCVLVRATIRRLVIQLVEQPEFIGTGCGVDANFKDRIGRIARCRRVRFARRNDQPSVCAGLHIGQRQSRRLSVDRLIGCQIERLEISDGIAGEVEGRRIIGAGIHQSCQAALDDSAACGAPSVFGVGIVAVILWIVVTLAVWR